MTKPVTGHLYSNATQKVTKQKHELTEAFAQPLKKHTKFLRIFIFQCHIATRERMSLNVPHSIVVVIVYYGII